MLSAAVSVGTRLKDWKMKPTRSRRSRVSCFSPRLPSSASPIQTSPEDSVSSPARQWSRVDFPEPEGPMIAVKRPFSMSRLMPSRARTLASPTPKTLTASTARRAKV